ncbi:MAG: type I methionyl aminopeptidase [bacterium]|nr:type I methionyl aminopeptidase [bacterium]
MIKTEEQIKKIRIAGKILASVAKTVREAIKPGVSLIDLDQLTQKLIKEAGAEPTFLGYQPYGAKEPFPAAICTSVNDVVVHGIPTAYKIKSGDILSVDFGVTYDDYIADAAFTVGVGEIPLTSKRLIEVTEHALSVGIKECQAGKTLGDIGYAINKYVKSHKFLVVKGLSGHGVGIALYEDPPVFNEGQKNTGLKLKAGMILALEPMVSAGDPYIMQKEDDSYATRDKSLSAHFEHTVLITKKGPEILTK